MVFLRRAEMIGIKAISNSNYAVNLEQNNFDHFNIAIVLLVTIYLYCDLQEKSTIA